MRYQHLRFPNGLAKAVTFSYDDGCRGDLRLAETLDRYGIKCTFNLSKLAQKPEHGLTAEEIKEHILSKGHEVAVHGYFHRAEGALRPIEGIRDVLDCRLELEHSFDRIIRGMAYPDSGITKMLVGTTFSDIKHYLKDLDIAYARTLGGDNDTFRLPEDFYAWMPTAHHNNAKIFDYIQEFVGQDMSVKQYGAYRYPRLFYLWGHSFEFDGGNNWDRLDRICEELGGKEDIWYTTNIEIYDYVMAYRSLVYSADGTMIYNPTVTTVWMDIDGAVYCIEPGKTVRI